jgi:hypothetical protein
VRVDVGAKVDSRHSRQGAFHQGKDECSSESVEELC